MTRSVRNVELYQRDREIRARARERTEQQLADEYGLTQQRIHQIVTAADPAEQMAQLEARLQAELAVLLTHHERNRRRIAVLRRTLDRIGEEQQVADIDKLLGLA